MTRRRPARRRGSARARRSRSSPRCRSACPARSPAGCSTPAGAPAPRSPLRIVVAALVLLVPACWRCAAAGTCCARNAGLDRRSTASLAVAGAQFCYFYAVSYMQVGVGAAHRVHRAGRRGRLALAAPRPAPRAAHRSLGAALAAVGLVLVLDLLSGADLEHGRRAVGAAARWSAPRRTSSSPPTRATACRRSCWPPPACVVGGRRCWLAGAGRAAADATRPPPRVYDGRDVAWWVPVLALGLVTARRRLRHRHRGRPPARLAGWRPSSRCRGAGRAGLAWLLLGELPRPVQLVGGLLILAGVVVVKLGERARAPLVASSRCPGRRVSVRPGA